MKHLLTRWFNRQSVTLGCFAFLIGSALALLNWLTATRIGNNRAQNIADTLAQVLPFHYQSDHSQYVTRQISDPDTQAARTVYVIRPVDNPPATVITAIATDGYAGDINLLVGITFDGTISGVRVTQHQETPGLGDDIEIRKSSWIMQFNGSTVSTPANWAVKRDGGDFDQLTGATITPRAIVRSVKQTLSFYHQYKTVIFADD